MIHREDLGLMRQRCDFLCHTENFVYLTRRDSHERCKKNGSGDLPIACLVLRLGLGP